MLFCAAYAGGQVLQAVHVEATASIAGWRYPLAAAHLFHTGYHLQLVRTAVVFVLRSGFRWR